jgi:hypothetical protein
MPYRTLRRARVEEHLARAYRAAGFVLSTAGKVLPQPPAATARAPGLSNHPKPKRSTMSTNRQLPPQIDSLGQVSKPDQQMYQSDGAGAYRLSFVGEALARYRRHVAENPGEDVPAPQKILRYAREDWTRLLAVAEPQARSYFIRMAASGVIKVVR